MFHVCCLLVVVVVEFTLLTSILSGITWTVAYSESLVSSGKVDGRCGEVGCRQEVSSTAAVRRRRNLFSQIVPFDIEGPGVEPGTTTEGCALLECQSRSGIAQSSTLVHGQPEPGSCSWWSWVCIVYETDLGASEGHAELQPRSDRICQFWGSNVQPNLRPTGDGRGGRHLSHREGCWRNWLACRWKHGPEFGWLMM